MKVEAGMLFELKQPDSYAYVIEEILDHLVFKVQIVSSNNSITPYTIMVDITWIIRYCVGKGITDPRTKQLIKLMMV